MANLSLTACSFLLKERNSRNKYHYLNGRISLETDTVEDELSTEDMFLRFFKEFENPKDDTDSKRTFHCEFEDDFKGDNDDYSYIYCVIKSGTYGSASDIIDNESREVVHRKTVNQTDEKSFYLYVIIPKDNPQNRIRVQKGMLFFQNVGQYGIKTVTSNYLKDYFSKNYQITFECKSIAKKLFVERMIKQSNVKKIVMVKNHKSRDKSDNFANGYGVETRSMGNLTFSKTMWEGIKEKVNNFVNNPATFFEFDGFECDQLKLHVQFNDNPRVINMGNLENLSLIEPIPENVQGLDGNPDKGKLMSHFNKIAKEYLKEMVLQINRE